MPENPPVARVVAVVLSELAAYVAIVFHLPVLVGAVALLGTVVITVQDFYPRVFGVVVSPVLGWLPRRFEFHLPDFVKACAAISIACYVADLGLRWWRGDRPPMRYRTRLGWTALFVTICWGFVLAHLPWMRVAPGASRAALGWVFVGFYVLTLGSFAAGLAFSWLVDRAADGVRRALSKEKSRES